MAAIRRLTCLSCLLVVVLSAQTTQSAPPSEPGTLAPGAHGVTTPGAPAPESQPEDKRVFGVLPNYRTAEMTSVYHPISAKYKMRIALKDSFDYPLVFLGAAYAGLYQLENSHPQFGQGAKGYFHRFATSYSDQVIGNMFSEGLMPIVFHEDPRYFRMAEGTVSKRTFYALSRIFVTKTDSGGTSFNFAEVVGNGAGAAIGLSYYSDDRNLADYSQNLGVALATDATSQVLKEFWPDIKHWYRKRHHKDQS